MTPPPPPPPPSSLLDHLTTIDTTISSTIYNLTQPLIPRPFLKLLELSGDGRLFFPIIISVLMFPVTTNAPFIRIILLNLLIGGVLDLIIIGLTKHLVKRRRPLYNKHMFLTFSVDQYSFPSGHASRVSFIASLIYFYSDLLFQSVSMFVIVWATVTSLSRVLLGRHFVFDVVVGGAIGVANAFCDCGMILIDWFEFTYFKSVIVMGCSACALKLNSNRQKQADGVPVDTIHFQVKFTHGIFELNHVHALKGMVVTFGSDTVVVNVQSMMRRCRIVTLDMADLTVHRCSSHLHVDELLGDALSYRSQGQFHTPARETTIRCDPVATIDSLVHCFSGPLEPLASFTQVSLLLNWLAPYALETVPSFSMVSRIQAILMSEFMD
ncbi:probable lipid phosphate phosphatase beta [Tanacetum coccineum]